MVHIIPSSIYRFIVEQILYSLRNRLLSNKELIATRSVELLFYSLSDKEIGSSVLAQ